MPLALAPVFAAQGFKLAQKAGLGKKVKQALWRGYGLIREGVGKAAKSAKFNITEKGLEGYSVSGISAKQNANESQVDSRGAMDMSKMNYLPYVVGGALLLILLKK